MGCCNPKYREVVNKQEEKINANGKHDVPLSLKILFGSIILTVIAIMKFTS